jgi:hypothetical protein
MTTLSTEYAHPDSNVEGGKSTLEQIACLSASFSFEATPCCVNVSLPQAHMERDLRRETCY